MKIQKIEISTHRITLDPSFPAAWDRQPRRDFPTVIVRVTTDQGLVGIGSGDYMYGFEDYAPMFLGADPLDSEKNFALLENIAFHSSRCWPLDVALWDLRGQIEQQPVYRLLGGQESKIATYASSGVVREPQQMVEQVTMFQQRGFNAVKLRMDPRHPDKLLASVALIRDQLGDTMQLMVDANQGWRMPWDCYPSWQLPQAFEFAQKLAEWNIHWLEEPLHRGDYQGMSELRQKSKIAIAGGEMTREFYEFRELIKRQCLDILQPDVVVTLGITGLHRVAKMAIDHGLQFTPHTWGNGIGLLANAHLMAAIGSKCYLEFPFDPPEWTCERRDFALATAIDVDHEGYLQLSDSPGLGLELDEDYLQKTLSGPIKIFSL